MDLASVCIERHPGSEHDISFSSPSSNRPIPLARSRCRRKPYLTATTMVSPTTFPVLPDQFVPFLRQRRPPEPPISTGEHTSHPYFQKGSLVAISAATHRDWTHGGSGTGEGTNLELSIGGPPRDLFSFEHMREWWTFFPPSSKLLHLFSDFIFYLLNYRSLWVVCISAQPHSFNGGVDSVYIIFFFCILIRHLTGSYGIGLQITAFYR